MAGRGIAYELAGTHTKHQGSANPVWHVTYKPRSGSIGTPYVEIVVEDDGSLQIRGSEALVIEPRVSNVIVVRLRP